MGPGRGGARCSLPNLPRLNNKAKSRKVLMPHEAKYQSPVLRSGLFCGRLPDYKQFENDHSKKLTT
jgi:hypothetical protein